MFHSVEVPTGYVRIYRWMSKLGLSPGAILVYAVIHTYTGHSVEGSFGGTVQTLADWSGLTTRRVSDILTQLVTDGLVEEITPEPGAGRARYRTTPRQSNDLMFVICCQWMAMVVKTPAERLVYAIVHSMTFAGARRGYNGSIDTLAALVGLKRRRLIDVLKSLVENGVIERDASSAERLTPTYTAVYSVVGGRLALHDHGEALL